MKKVSEKKFRENVKNIVGAMKKLDKAIKVAQRKPIPLTQSIQLVLPDDTAIDVCVWKNDVDEKKCSVTVMRGNFAVNMRGYDMTLRWDMKHMKQRYAGIFKKIKIPQNAVAIYYNGKKRQLYNFNRRLKNQIAISGKI